MRRRPLSPRAPILGKFLISRIVLIALTMSALTLGIYAIYSNLYGSEYGRTIAFSALVVMQWANAIGLRSDDEPIWARLKVWNGKFYAGLTIAVTLQMLALFGPLGSVLHVSRVAIGDLVITGAIAFVTPIILIEMHKYLGRRFFGRGAAVHTARTKGRLVKVQS
jgi:magnesium-transporting ATPase (P-type)